MGGQTECIVGYSKTENTCTLLIQKKEWAEVVRFGLPYERGGVQMLAEVLN